jgi:F-box protein 39
MRTQNCLATVGKNIRNLIFEPMFNFYNLYEFMVMLSYYAERNEEEKLGKVVYHRGNIVPVH